MRGRGTPTSIDAEPGTGTQTHVVASPPCGCPVGADCNDVAHERPNAVQYNGTRWKAGHDYLDTVQADIVELTSVVRKSAWCDTDPAEEGTLVFCFEGERVGQYRVRPADVVADPDRSLGDRFIERTETQRPRGAPPSPW